jgi:hypothetical protein
MDPDPLVRGTDPDPYQNVTDPKHCFGTGIFVVDQMVINKYKKDESDG